MRALAAISTVVLFSAALAGCDMPGSGQQQAAAPPPAPAPATMTAPPSPTEHLTRLSYGRMPYHDYHRHDYRTAGYRPYRPYHHHYAYSGGYYADRSQQSVDSYNYVSTSTLTRSESSYSSGYSSYSGYGGYQSRQIVWVDGYGRGYFAGSPPTVAQSMRGERLDPYNGYLADCPQSAAY